MYSFHMTVAIAFHHCLDPVPNKVPDICDSITAYKQPSCLSLQLVYVQIMLSDFDSIINVSESIVYEMQL